MEARDARPRGRTLKGPETQESIEHAARLTVDGAQRTRSGEQSLEATVLPSDLRTRATLDSRTGVGHHARGPWTDTEWQEGRWAPRGATAPDEGKAL